MKRRKKKLSAVDIISTLVLTIGVMLIVIPFWNAIVISFQTSKDYSLHPFAWWPNEFTLDNYKYLLKEPVTLLNAYKGTIYVTVVGTLFGMTVSIMAAFVFSREFPGKRFLFKMYLFTMYFGGGLIPTYLLLKNLHLINSLNATVLISLVSVYNIIIMKNGFESVPMELQEAAMIDGATDLKIFARIMLPLQKPLIATFSLFTAVGYWNTWYWPMLTLNRTDVSVLQLYLRNIVNSISAKEIEASSAFETMNTFSQGIKMATVFLVMVPIMVVYPFLQKYFTKGIMVGAVKM